LVLDIQYDYQRLCNSCVGKSTFRHVMYCRSGSRP
jgi:hypothetical protein